MQNKTIRVVLFFTLLATVASSGLVALSGKHIGALPSAQAAATRKPSPRVPQPHQPKASVSPLSQTPLAFVQNRGQADARAAFLVQGRDTTAYFTMRGLTLAFTH